jgi:hypothetical protein
MTPPPDNASGGIFARLATALSASQHTALTQEQMDDVVYKAQAMEQMRVNRLHAFANIDHLAADFEQYLAQNPPRDAQAEAVLRKFAQVELLAYADKQRVLVGQADEHLIRSAVTPPQRVIEVKDVTPTSEPQTFGRRPGEGELNLFLLVVVLLSWGAAWVIINSYDRFTRQDQALYAWVALFFLIVVPFVAVMWRAFAQRH